MRPAVEEIVGMDDWSRFRGFSAVLRSPLWEKATFDNDALTYQVPGGMLMGSCGIRVSCHPPAAMMQSAPAFSSSRAKTWASGIPWPRMALEP